MRVGTLRQLFLFMLVVLYGVDAVGRPRKYLTRPMALYGEYAVGRHRVYLEHFSEFWICRLGVSFAEGARAAIKSWAGFRRVFPHAPRLQGRNAADYVDGSYLGAHDYLQVVS